MSDKPDNIDDDLGSFLEEEFGDFSSDDMSMDFDLDDDLSSEKNKDDSKNNSIVTKTETEQEINLEKEDDKNNEETDDDLDNILLEDFNFDDEEEDTSNDVTDNTTNNQDELNKTEQEINLELDDINFDDEEQVDDLSSDATSEVKNTNDAISNEELSNKIKPEKTEEHLTTDEFKAYSEKNKQDYEDLHDQISELSSMVSSLIQKLDTPSNKNNTQEEDDLKIDNIELNEEDDLLISDLENNDLSFDNENNQEEGLLEEDQVTEKLGLEDELPIPLDDSLVELPEPPQSLGQEVELPEPPQSLEQEVELSEPPQSLGNDISLLENNPVDNNDVDISFGDFMETKEENSLEHSNVFQDNIEETPQPPLSTDVLTENTPINSEPSIKNEKNLPSTRDLKELEYVPQDVMSWGGHVNADEAEEIKQGQAVQEVRQELKENTPTLTSHGKRKKTRGKGGAPQFLQVDQRFEKPLILSFTSPKGGVGKSTTSLNFAAFLAKSAELSNNPMRVLILDGDTANGNLALRAGAPLTPNMLDVILYLEEYGEIKDYDEMAQFVFGHQRIKNLDILPSPESVETLNELNQDHLSKLMLTLANFYQVIVIDTGTQIIELTNQIWLAFSTQVYLMVEPDIACLESSRTYAKRVRKLNLVGPDDFRIVMIKSDIQADIDPKKISAKVFNWVRENKFFFMSDYQRDTYIMGNIGDFLVLESPEYASEIKEIVESSLLYHDKGEKIASNM